MAALIIVLVMLASSTDGFSDLLQTIIGKSWVGHNLTSGLHDSQDLHAGQDLGLATSRG